MTDLHRYGDDKGACENIFSYGFIEDTMTSAKVIFLDLDIPDDDPLKPAKIFISTAAPGFRMSEQSGNIDWESDFIWLVIVNEEDGLDFKVRQTIDGKREIQALWKDNDLDDTSKLREFLCGDPLWDVYQLRATVLLQGRVEMQIELLKGIGTPQKEAPIREGPWSLANRLRKLELEMLERAMKTFEDQVRNAFSYPAFSLRATAVRKRYISEHGIAKAFAAHCFVILCARSTAASSREVSSSQLQHAATAKQLVKAVSAAGRTFLNVF